MKIGEFIKKVNTTKDTVRHYEQLDLIRPTWINNRRIYEEKDIRDFEAIKEMQNIDMSLKEVQIMFEVKRTSGCGSPELLAGAINKMKEKKREIELEEQALTMKKDQLTETLEALEALKMS